MNESKVYPPVLIDEYNYPLPEERIAKFPLKERDASKLLVYQNDKIIQSNFTNIAEHLPEDSILVYNNTRVIQARINFRKSTGAKIEVFCLEPLFPSDYVLSLGSTKECEWKCMVGNLKKWKEETLSLEIEIRRIKCKFNAKLLNSEGNTHTVRFCWDNNDIHFAEILETAGELPIPPYLHRKTQESDLSTYQTVYSKIKGSVAAPTAGLHFTSNVFEKLHTKNISTTELTLHVGAGTFQPVKSQDIADHTMHTEFISVNRESIEHLINKAGKIIAVGTTSVRTLESLYYLGINIGNSNTEPTKQLHVSQWAPYQNTSEIPVNDALKNILKYLDDKNLKSLHASTQILIKPGFKFRLTEGIITNFHQPKSTLLLLVSAFLDGKWKAVYDYALNNDFRFLSYGDSSLLLKQKTVNN